ncbi:beta-N-acetylhexosaminidase, partial [Flavobacterium sp. HMWF030]
MKKSILLIAIFLSSLSTIQAQKLDIIPKPVKVEQKEGAFIIPSTVQIIVDKKIQKSSDYIKASLLKNAGINSTVTAGDTHKKNTISFLVDEKMSFPNEGYKLSVTKKGVLVKGKSVSGVLNGFQTLVQICSAKDVKKGTIPF